MRPEAVEQWLASAQVVRCPTLPDDVNAYHMAELIHNPELAAITEALGLSVQAICAMDERLWGTIKWYLAYGEGEAE